MTEHLSRRTLLELSGAVFGGISALDGRVIENNAAASEITGWITKGTESRIAGRTAVIQSIEDPGTTMCNSGELYRFQTCGGTEGYLLVGFGTPQPSVGASYRFVATGEKNWCGNFRVELQSGASCDDATADGPLPDESEEADPTTESTAEAPPTTEPAETTSETTTEATDPTTELEDQLTEADREEAETTADE